MKNKVTVDTWPIQKEAARFVRMRVFVMEQQIPPELECDHADELSLHAVATDSTGAPVGTGRLLPDGHIGRLAVLASERGNGTGGQLLQHLMDAARARGDKRVELNAQSAVKGFYSYFGFTVIGDEFLEAGIQHIKMAYCFN